MVSESARIIDQIVVQPLSAELRRLGFRKAARTFRRQAAECVQVINVQGSSWNSPDDAKVTVNLGVYYPAVAALLNRPLFGRAGPLDADCHARERIGCLLPEHLDRWWALSTSLSASEVSAITSQVCDAVLGPGLAWLEAHVDLAMARDDHLRDNTLWLAAVDSLALNDREAAARLLRQAIEGFPSGAARMSEWGQVHGLLPMAAS